jgi:hypothetical protein
MIVAMSMAVRRWVQIDFRGRPVEQSLQPAAQEGDEDQAHSRAEMRPKGRQPAGAAARRHARPYEGRKDTQEQQRRPRSLTEDRPEPFPIDRGKPPDDPYQKERPDFSQLPYFRRQIAKIADEFPKRGGNA